MRELSLHILDVLENSVEAGATRIELTIVEDLPGDRLIIDVRDNGRGMDKEFVRNVLNPFVTTRTTRHVGLGLPLFAAAAQRSNGALTVESEKGKGTRLTATFQHSHIDRAPLGDLVGALMGILVSDRPCDLALRHEVYGRCYQFDTADVRRELGDVPLSHPKVREWLFDTLTEGELELYSGVNQSKA